MQILCVGRILNTVSDKKCFEISKTLHAFVHAFIHAFGPGSIKLSGQKPLDYYQYRSYDAIR